MPYISELLNNRVYDSSDANVGKLEDILIRAKDGTFPALEFLVVKTSDKQTRYVPYSAVANFTSSKISLKNLFNNISLQQLQPQQYIRLKRDVLDQQIVDVAGTRVVRVNDLRIGSIDNKTCVLAIDPSFRGLLRRLGFEDDILVRMFKVRLIDWRQAQLVDNKGELQLNTLTEHLSHLHPADLANIVEDLDVQQGSDLLASLDAEKAAKVLEEVDPRWQGILVKYLGPKKASRIVSQMSADELADLVKELSSEEGESLLSHVGTGKAADIKKLIPYEDNTAGGLMSLEYIAVRPDWSVSQVTEVIKEQSPNFRSISYVYVTSEDGKLLGVVSLRTLITSSPEDKVKALAKALDPTLTLKPNDKISKIMQFMTKYNLYSAAVVDKHKKMLGVVTIDDVMRDLFPNA